MSIKKPMQITPYNRCFTYKKKYYFSLGALVGFKLTEEKILLEDEIWSNITECSELNLVDQGLPKPYAEYLIYGKAQTTEYKPKRQIQVSIQVGELEKNINVTGESYWSGLPGFKVKTPPIPFKEMPLTAEKSYGGKGYSLNPDGQGFTEIKTEEGETRLAVPCIQLVDAPQTSPGGHTKQAYTTAQSLMLEQRMKLSGTYDDNYITHAMPGLPDDFDWLFTQDALKDQRFKTSSLPLGCNFKLNNLNHEHPEIKGKLPKIKVLVTYTRQSSEEIFVEELNPETAIFLPNQDSGLLIFRKPIACNRADGKDITELMYAIENFDHPKGKSHYIEELEKRCDEDQGWLLSMETQDLLPNDIICGFKMLENEGNDIPEIHISYDDKMDHFKEKGMENINKNIDELEEKSGQKLDKEPEKLQQNEFEEKIDEFMQKHLPTDDEGMLDFKKAEPLTDESFETLFKEIDQISKKEVEENIIPKLEEMLANEHLKDKQEEIKKQIDLIRNPPPEVWARFPEEETIINIDEAINDLRTAIKLKNETLSEEKENKLIYEKLTELTELKRDLDEVSNEFFDAILMNAEEGEKRHPVLSNESRNSLQTKIAKCFDKEHNLPVSDLSDMQFEEKKLYKVDFSRFFLEGIRFHKVIFHDCNFKESITVFSEFIECTFKNCSFEKSNLGSSNINSCRFENCNLSGANLNYSALIKATFDNCNLNETQVDEIKIEACVFIASSLEDLYFDELQLNGSEFIGSTLSNTQFTDCNLSNVTFNDSQLPGLGLIDCKLFDSNFDKCNLENSRLMGSEFIGTFKISNCFAENSSFNKTKVNSAFLTNNDLSLTDFEESSLIGTDFSSSKLHYANFADCSLNGAIFNKASLIGASFHYANISEANFESANLYTANLMYATVFKTDFFLANLDRTLLQDWRPNE